MTALTAPSACDVPKRSVTAFSVLTCTVLTNEDSWLQLREDWEQLSTLTPGLTPWQHWEFLSSWWRFMGNDRSLRLCVVCGGGKPQLIMPLQISIVRTLGVELRVLEPVAMPNDINRPRLAIGAENEACYRAALEAAWAFRDDWDLLRIDEKIAGDWETGQLREFAKRRGLIVREVALHPCPYLNLKQTWAQFLVSRSSHLRKNLRAAARRLEARGPWRIRCYTAPQEIEAGFAILLDVHSRSWKAAERIGLSQSEPYRALYRSFVQAMAQVERIRIWVLHCNDVPIAATLALHDETTYFSALIAHDEAYSACSPGTLLEAEELHALMDEGRFASYDFLGAALANKLRWTDASLSTMRVQLVRSTWRSTLVDLYYFRVKPTLKHWLRRHDAQHQRRSS
jgi:CelD/BcsL family acetyltransferase involved in cellulose biosynthesis